MKSLMIGANFALIAVLCASAGSGTDTTPAPPPPGSGGGVAWRDLPMTTHFSAYLGPAGLADGTGGWAPFSVTFPTNLGVAITKLDAIRLDTWPVSIRVGGNEVWRGQVKSGGSQSAASPAVFDPPIIVPPGQSLVIGVVSPNLNDYTDLSVVGHRLQPSDLGL